MKSEVDKYVTDNKPIKKPVYGFMLASITGGIALLVSAVGIAFVAPALRKICLPYVPATHQQIGNVLKALEGRGGTFVDLGSGDGRIVVQIAIQKPESKATGLELNPFLICYSKFYAWKRGIAKSVHFMRKDFWKFDLSSFDNVIIFGVEEMMPDLQSKLSSELRDDARVIACRFPLPNWKPLATVGRGIDSVWIYKKNKKFCLEKKRAT